MADDTALSPLIAADLDGDGLDDLLALGANLLYRNQGGRFAPEPLLAYPPPVGRIEVALLADFTGDGAPDLIVGGPGQLLGLYEGGKGFDQPGLAIATRPLQYPEAMSAGDIDGDGDLDLWVGQYRLPYREGQMPTPYYGRQTDGYPAYLLSNDGTRALHRHHDPRGPRSQAQAAHLQRLLGRSRRRRRPRPAGRQRLRRYRPVLQRRHRHLRRRHHPHRQRGIDLWHGPTSLATTTPTAASTCT